MRHLIINAVGLQIRNNAQKYQVCQNNTKNGITKTENNVVRAG